MSSSRDYFLLTCNQHYRWKLDVVSKLDHWKDTKDNTLNSNTYMNEDITNLDFWLNILILREMQSFCI